MPDEFDRLQEMEALHVANALEHQRRQALVRKPGLTRCETLDCGEAITPARTQLGGRLCEDCEREDSIRRSQYARGRW